MFQQRVLLIFMVKAYLFEVRIQKIKVQVPGPDGVKGPMMLGGIKFTG